jgi:large subunit ribosomal protein L28
MSYACEICGKGKQFGHNVPFSKKKTNKVWKPNLQRQYINLGDSRVQVKICTQCLRTLKKFKKDDTKVEATVAAAK